MQRVVVVLPLVPVTATTGMRASSPGANIESTMALPHRATDAARRLDVHAQTRGRVDFHDRAAALLERFGHVGGDDIDASDVEPDHARGFDRARCDARMNRVRDVGGGAARAQIRVAAQHYDLTPSRYAVDGERLLGQDFATDLVQYDLAQRGRVIVTAARIEIHRGDELSDRTPAVAHDLRRFAARRRDQAAIDHEQPKVRALDVAFDDDFPIGGEGDFERRNDRFAGPQAHRDAPPLVATTRFHDHGQAELLRRRPGRLRGRRGRAFGHRDPPPRRAVTW